MRPNVEKQHGVVRSDCVTLPAFRVTYALQPRGADRTRVELTLGADPGIPCPPWLIRWGLGHADRTLEALEPARDALFPKTFEYVTVEGGTRTTERRPLFGDLVDAVQWSRLGV